MNDSTINFIFHLIIYSFLFIILFTLFIEFYIGNIFIRPDSYGIPQYNFLSLSYYLIHPLHNLFLWNKRILFCNFPFMYGLFLLIFYNLYQI